MFKRVDHIAIAVRNLRETKERMEELFGAKLIVEARNEKGQYRVAIFQVGENIFAMQESSSPDGFVAKHIERYGETMQHMGIEVEDIQKFMEQIHAHGLKTYNYTEIQGVRKEVVVGPNNPMGVPLQVFEWLGEYKKASPSERMAKAWG
jgi:methylmalonyl-CoA/ethylmalonyl-CoA epimerase